MKFAKTSLALLAIQLTIVSSIAAKYLYQRWSCPRVWTRTVAYDPELVMRGRYLSLRLTVDGCGRIAPPEKLKDDPNNPNLRNRWFILSQADRYSVRLTVENNKLVAIPLSGAQKWRGYNPISDGTSHGIVVLAPPGASCDALQIDAPADFYIAEHAADPTRTKPGQELWIEVTVPPKGPPRPIQLALKQDGAWKPLAFQ
jgi:hypothetical protein